MTISVIRGDDHILKVSVTKQDDSAIDITGDLIFFTIKVNKTDTDNQAIYKFDEYIKTSADATAGIHRLTIPNNLPLGTYQYDVQLKRDVSGVGEVSTLEISTIAVTQDITVRSTAT